jgi:DNA-binding GntR family transcriptional regulator
MPTAAERLYRKLKKDIVECELSPGKSLSEADMGRRYKIGRTPVREACRRLQNEGLVRIIPFRGYFIAPLSVAEFHDLEETQMVFEPETAAMAAQRATNDQIAAMESCATYEYRVGDKESYWQFLEKNHHLHVAIAEATGNKELVAVINGVHTRLMRFFFIGVSLDAAGPQLVQEHCRIVEAIRKRNPEQARQRALEHVRKSMERSASSLMAAIRLGEAVFEPAPKQRSARNTRARKAGQSAGK